MSTPPVLRLMYRNIRVNMDPGNLIILVGIPAMYLVFFGLGVQSMVPQSATGTQYISFLTPGIMGFQAVMAGIVGGSMLWADKRYGMLAQLLMGPFSRLQYFLGIVLTSVIFGLAGAVVMLLGAYLLIGPLSVTLFGFVVMMGVITVGSVFFGSLMLLISAFVKSNNAYTGIQVLIIFIVNFASTVFYPLSSSLPLSMKALFLVNPLTYVVNMTRDGFVGLIPLADLNQFFLLCFETVLLLVLATRAYMRSGVSFE
jgi:ABC-2 type transport system permease protein